MQKLNVPAVTLIFDQALWFLHATYCCVLTIICAKKNQILPCIMKSWVSHDSGTHKRKHTQAYTHMNRINSICPLAMLWPTLYCADRRIFHIYAKYCQSISKCFRVTYLNSRVDARVVANVAGRKYERMENRIPVPHHAGGMRDIKVMSRTQIGLTETLAQTVSADCGLDL